MVGVCHLSKTLILIFEDQTDRLHGLVKASVLDVFEGQHDDGILSLHGPMLFPALPDLLVGKVPGGKMQDTIIKLLEQWQRKRQRDQER